jgi:metal-responsive CopG/Arc/MetJ family transcriptional regulator
MDGKIVSIRMTSSMLKELKEITKQEHFMDVSDAVRSIVRSKWLENNNSTNITIDNKLSNNDNSNHQLNNLQHKTKKYSFNQAV